MKIKRPKKTLPFKSLPSDPADGHWRIAVVGSKDWISYGAIRRYFLKFLSDLHIPDYQHVCVITTDGAGVPQMIEELCLNEWNIPCMVFRAPREYWRRMDKIRMASPMRDDWLIRWAQPHAVLAIHQYLPGSATTKAFVEIARQHDIARIRLVGSAYDNILDKPQGWKRVGI